MRLCPLTGVTHCVSVCVFHLVCEKCISLHACEQTVVSPLMLQILLPVYLHGRVCVCVCAHIIYDTHILPIFSDGVGPCRLRQSLQIILLTYNAGSKYFYSLLCVHVCIHAHSHSLTLSD